MRKLAALTLFAVAAWGQPVSRVYHFATIKDPKTFQDVANIFRGIADVQDVSVQATAATLTADGTAAQMALTDWLFPQLDQSSTKPAPADHTYQMTGDLGTVHVFHFVQAAIRPQIQEIVNVVRSTADVPRVFQLWDTAMMVVRGTADQVGVAEWLVSQLDAAGPNPSAPIQAHQIADPRNPEIRIAHLTHTTSPQAIQEMINSMRTIVDMNRVFPVNTEAVVVFRGTADQMKLGEWVLGQIDQAAGQQGPAPHQQEFSAPWDNFGNPTQARVFYFTHADSPAAIQEIVNAVRTNAHINRAYPCLQPKALVLRGTAEQVTQAADLIAQLDR